MSPNSFSYSILDLAPIVTGGTAGESFRNTLDLAQHAERWGYRRFWLAEHHSIPGVASAATSVLIGHVAGGTSRIRVGSGGIMLPNHSPLVIAEQFGTLESLYPGRIDLGVGRAPGGDARTTRALRRHLSGGADTFPDDLAELLAYFRGEVPGVTAIPGRGLDVPLYLLGSSDFSARLAAELGLPFAFASHFAPDYLAIALNIYREHFKPSRQLDRPHVMVGVNVVVADTADEARRQFTTIQQAFLNLVRGVPGEIPPPLPSMEGRWSAPEEAHIMRMMRYSAIGDPDTAAQHLEQIVDQTQADEIVATAQLHDHGARLRSFELAAGVFQRLGSRAGVATR
jgi:luciferase family oxidoreductase group 1